MYANINVSQYNNHKIMTLLPPTPAQQKCIDKKLPPDPEMRKQDVRALREWLLKQPHLPNHIGDDKLETFLFNCKNNIEKCKSVLERYYTARTFLPEFFAARDPLSQDIQSSFSTVDLFVLPSLTEEGHRVGICRLIDTDVEKFSFKAFVRRSLMMMDIRLMEEMCMSNIMIIDLEGCSMAHCAKMSPTQTLARRAILTIVDSMPCSISCIYFLHISSFATKIVKAFYPFLKEKLTQKFRIYNGGAEELYAFMNKDIFPNEWGGKAGTFQELNAAWRGKIEKYRDWLLEDEKLSRTNENARLSESKTSYLMEFEDTHGSFRKLNID